MDCLKHATRPNGLIDWDVYKFGLFGHRVLSDLSSDSDTSSDSNCVFLYATSGADHKGEVCQKICPYTSSSSYSKGRMLLMTYRCELEMNEFTEEVLQEYLLYLEVATVNLFWSNLDISYIENEEDVVVLPCHVGERVCDQRLANIVDESFLMYMAVLDESFLMYTS